MPLQGGRAAVTSLAPAWLNAHLASLAEVACARHEVESMASFIDEVDKLDDYIKWAAERRKKADVAVRLTKLAEKEAREHKLQMKRMESAFKLKQAEVNAKTKAEKAYQKEYDDRDRYGGDYSDVCVAPRRRRPRAPPRRGRCGASRAPERGEVLERR